MIDSTIQKINAILTVGFTAFGLWVIGVSYFHVFTG